jgi:FlgD Ig-like domain
VTLLARAVFVLLVGATFSAFFVAQRLKSTPPVVDVGRLTKFFSPNGDGRRDVNEISFTVKEADDVTVSVVDADGSQVRRLATGVAAKRFRPVVLSWDGRTDSGTAASDGLYRLRFALRRQGRSVVVQRAIDLDTTAPRPVIVSVKPPIAGPQPGAFEIRVRGAGRRLPPQFRVLRTDVSPEREVARFSGRKGSRRAVWGGQVDGAPAPPGTYIVVPFVEDRSGNVGSAPAALPPEPGTVPGKPGITVRQLNAQPPLEPVRAGARVEFAVDSRRRSYRWRVRRVGAPRAVKKGSAKPGEPLVMRAPEGISGAFLLELRSGRYSTSVPFLVQSAKRARLLVVVPAITWLGLDRVDDDGDGLPNTLTNGGPVKWPRVIVGDGGLPAEFAAQTAPLLVFLDRARIRYDLTTDIALSDSRDPRATDREGVVLAGSERWVPRDLARRLRRYTADGGRLASFGTETLRRGVQVGSNRLRRPTQATPGDPFGARLDPFRRARTAAGGGEVLPLTPLADDPALKLLTGSDGTLAGFRTLEESRARPESSRAKLLVGLGQDVTDAERADAEAKGELPREAEPALTATRLGKGLVIRIGLPDWPVRTRSDPEVAQITRNIIDILRRVEPRIRSAER